MTQAGSPPPIGRVPGVPAGRLAAPIADPAAFVALRTGRGANGPAIAATHGSDAALHNVLAGLCIESRETGKPPEPRAWASAAFALAEDAP